MTQIMSDNLLNDTGEDKRRSDNRPKGVQNAVLRYMRSQANIHQTPQDVEEATQYNRTQVLSALNLLHRKHLLRRVGRGIYVYDPTEEKRHGTPNTNPSPSQNSPSQNQNQNQSSARLFGPKAGEVAEVLGRVSNPQSDDRDGDLFVVRLESGRLIILKEITL